MVTEFASIVWDPSLGPFSIFGYEIRYYSLCWVIGLLGAYLIVKKLYKKQGVKEELFEPLSCIALWVYLWEHVLDTVCSINRTTI